MARAAKATKRARASVRGRKLGRPPSSATKAAPNGRRPSPLAKSATATKPVAATAVPKVSKDELRALVEKLVLANATLRTENRESNRAAKTAAARIAELEGQVARLEKKIAAQANAPGLRGGSIGLYRPPSDATP